MCEKQTKVCKACNEEKSLDEFYKREKGYYRATCKVCMNIQTNKLQSEGNWDIEEFRIVIDALLNKRYKNLNEVLIKLNNKTMEDLIFVIKEKVKIFNTELNIESSCLYCNKAIIIKPCEYLSKEVRFCSLDCSAKYHNENELWGNKSNEFMEWFGTKEEFIRNYRLLGITETAKYYNKNEKTIIYWASKYELNREIVVSNLSDFEVIKLYDLILENKINSFPNGFSKNDSYAIVLIRHLINDILKWNRQDICNNLQSNLFLKYKLDSCVNYIDGYFDLIKNSFPEYNLKRWELKHCTNLNYNFWNDEENVNEALIWLREILNKEKFIDSSEKLSNYNLKKLLHDYNLHNLCIFKYNKNSKEMFKDVYKVENFIENEIEVFEKCIKCEIDKPYNKNYFPERNQFSLFGLGFVCKECIEKEDTKQRYSKLGIIYNNINDIIPEQWYEYFYNNEITQMPLHCYKEDNMVKIIRFIVFNKMGLTKKEEICKNVNCPNLNNYKINVTQRFQTKLEMLQKCFFEYNIDENDILLYDDQTIIDLTDNWRKEQNISIMQILKSNGINNSFNQDMKNIMQYVNRHKGMTIMDYFLWYMNIKNILYPKTNKPIIDLDFNNKNDGFWDNSENRIRAIKYYCEYQCKDSIFNFISNYQDLQKWVVKYFSKKKLKHLYYFNVFKIPTFDLLIEAYPSIKDNNLLFSWELSRNNDTSKEDLIKVLREYVFYRMNNICVDIKRDLPQYLNNTYIYSVFPKFSAYIYSKHKQKRFDSYYQWACLSFPEYANDWTELDFGITATYDGEKCGSIQEKMIYEFIQRDCNLKYFTIMSSKRSGNFVFKLGEDFVYKKFCPDFVLEYIEKNGEKVKLIKPIIFEYYGWYSETNQHHIFDDYRKKTLLKNQFYKSREDIHFIDLYPDDLKNNFEGVRQKLTSFFMLNCNIDFNNF